MGNDGWLMDKKFYQDVGKQNNTVPFQLSNDCVIKQSLYGSYLYLSSGW
jgi:hypothetical protein